MNLDYLSDPLKMNDKLEIKWYLDKLNKDNQKSNLSESIFDRMKMRSGLDFSFAELLNIPNFKGQKSVYVAC